MSKVKVISGLDLKRKRLVTLYFSASNEDSSYSELVVRPATLL